MNIDERAASLVGDMPWITEHLTDAQIGDMKRQIAASMRALTAAEPQEEAMETMEGHWNTRE